MVAAAADPKERNAAVTRRFLLAGLAGFGLAGWSHAAMARQGTPRIVALDAPATEMLVALGVEPVGVAGLAGYRAAEGDLPALRRAVDIGFYYEPNLELLQALAPECFIGSFGIGAPPALLERIAPVMTMPIYGGAGSTYDAACAAMSRAGQVTGRDSEAASFLAAHAQHLSELATRVSGRILRPLYLATPLLDGRHVILYGENSLFDAVMRRVGLRNAFTGPASAWGIASVGIEQLAADPDASFVYIASPVTRNALKQLHSSAIWSLLPFVVEGRVAPISYLEMYGALPTADRFAAALGGLLDTDVLDAG